MTRLKDAGATEYLTKPIDIPLVIKTIRSIVDQEKSQARSHKPGNDLQG
jgi:DNA-binding response OmpR family regulator